MGSQASGSQTSGAAEESAISGLYEQVLECWNRRNADDFAALFDEDGYVVGFDGSQMNGRAEIGSAIRRIFADHQTAAYVGKVRGVRFLTPEVALLGAVAGMVPPGQSDLNPAVNAIQTLVAVKRDGRWRIALYQNTPAQFHRRPELSEALTAELRQLL
ncbi:MAG TPA: SgcJ/EcaC family oxidoreductase [Blastocatellia bacterium]|nr:SgcJ/EcaC family oxidoreductase [Blastocatellia bacterium]